MEKRKVSLFNISNNYLDILFYQLLPKYYLRAACKNQSHVRTDLFLPIRQLSGWYANWRILPNALDLLGGKRTGTKLYYQMVNLPSSTVPLVLFSLSFSSLPLLQLLPPVLLPPPHQHSSNAAYRVVVSPPPHGTILLLALTLFACNGPASTNQYQPILMLGTMNKY